MANTIDTALIVDSVSSTAVTVLGKRLAPLRAFSKDFSSDVKRAGDVVQVKLATAGSTTLVNPTSFDSVGASTLDNSAVTLEHIYQPFGLEYTDIKNGIKLEDIMKANLNAFAAKIWDKVTAHVTVANFGAAVATQADSAVTPGSAYVKAAWAAVSKSDEKVFIANAGIYSNFIPTSTTSLPLQDGSYGFDRGVHYASTFNGEAKLAAFAAAPEALATAMYMPVLPNEGEYLVVQPIEVPSLGITILHTVASYKNTRSLVGTFEVMFGSNTGIKTDTVGIILNP